MKSVYLDNAATTQIRDEVVDKMFEIAKSNYGNPSSTHSFGRGSRTLVESSRKKIANWAVWNSFVMGLGMGLGMDLV